MRVHCERIFDRKIEAFAAFLEEPVNKNNDQSVKLTSENQDLLKKFAMFLEMDKSADKCEKHGDHWPKHGRFGKHGHHGIFGHHFGHHHPFGKHSHGFGRHGPHGPHGHGPHGHGHHGHHGHHGNHGNHGSHGHHGFGKHWFRMNEGSESTNKEDNQATETERNPSPLPEENATNPQGVNEQLIRKYVEIRRMGHCRHGRCNKGRRETTIAASNEKGENSTQTEAATNQEASQNLAAMVENIDITNSPASE